jgi:hypothetical protein
MPDHPASELNPRPMRTGRHLSQTPGLTTLYLEAEGPDHLEDRCVGMVDGPDLAAAIVETWNAFYGLAPRAAIEQCDG